MIDLLIMFGSFLFVSWIAYSDWRNKCYESKQDSANSFFKECSENSFFSDSVIDVSFTSRR